MSWNPWSTANKLQDLEDILDEEKEGLNIKSININKFKVLQNNLSELVNEKTKLNEAMNNPNIDDLEKMRLSRRLVDLNDAIYNANNSVTSFGDAYLKNNRDQRKFTKYDEPVNESSSERYMSEKEKPERINFGYKDYTKKYSKDAFAFSKLAQGESNSTPTNMVPANNVASDSTSKSVPVVEVKSAPKTVSRASSNNSSTFDDNNTKSGIRVVDLNDFIIVDSKK